MNERRAVARYLAKLTVNIEMDDFHFDAVTKEISLQGLRILCTGPIANSVFKQYIRVTPGENITAKIHINALTIHNSDDIITCLTRVISVNRVSQDSYLVGFNIIEFDDERQIDWQNFITKNY